MILSSLYFQLCSASFFIVLATVYFLKKKIKNSETKLYSILIITNFFGLVLGAPMAIVTIFLATFIAFPIALIILALQKDNIIPFGPFLSMAAILILISKLNIQEVIGFIVK